ncbi:ABC transporter G family member 20-like [Neocloeon triangulifer]|uniref:ABC transporter G family member 20-like n=1 Tax=Neocloeon triangulifer TaxID=2078957 RepID=UPI00286EC0F2|nr:ABC transporter G family member 20-like [Neocloeon triangulifer]
MTTEIMEAAPVRELAVSVRDAFKFYGSKKKPVVVLNHLNMTVPRGCIYGLLGASGCGKTTLLTCIVGRRKLMSGQILVLGGRPGTPGSGVPGPKVGYMPQETALLNEFTIRNTMNYFGKIYGMTNDEVEDRMHLLCCILELPPKDTQILHLSGGQKRRVSLAAALLHDPELLILDEPTVGVDPVLRHSIWEYLVEITQKENKAVIITTHYIEEARQANRIGLMREGTLLAEDAPENLIRKHNCETLEDVFLMLSRRQEELKALGIEQHKPAITQSQDAKHNVHLPVVEIQEHIQEEMLKSKKMRKLKPTILGALQSQLMMTALRYYRNPGSLYFLIMFPILQLLIFVYAVGHEPRSLHLAVVNEELSLDNVTKCFELAEPGCDPPNLSCRFLNEINPEHIIPKFYDTWNDSLEAVRTGKVWGAMHIGSNFTEALKERREVWQEVSDELIEDSEIAVSLDMSELPVAQFLSKELLASYKRFSKQYLKDCNISVRHGETPIQFQEPIFGSSSPNFTDFMASGSILTIVYFMSLGITCVIMVTETMEGIWDRALVAGVTEREVLMSHIVTQTILMIIQVVIVLTLSLAILKLENEGSILLITIICLIIGWFGVFMGVLISIFCSNINSASYFSLGSFVPVVFLSGIAWPLEGMLPALRTYSEFLPITRATTTLRAIMSRGWGIEYPDVYNGFAYSAIWTVIVSIICFIGVKYKKC